MRILALGDVCGEAGCHLLTQRLGALKKKTGADLTIVNGENATGRGISADLADDIFYAGADVITLGNHAFANRRICSYLDDHPCLLRPANMNASLPGSGTVTLDCCGVRVCIVSLLGRLYMDFHTSDPFAAADQILAREQADLFVFDFHADATSEKKAMGYHLDGRACAVFGTHTHVPTADARILPKGTGYITDLGMTGAQESVIGVKFEQSVAYFRGQLAPRFENSDLDCHIQGAVFDIGTDGRCRSVERADT